MRPALLALLIAAVVTVVPAQAQGGGWWTTPKVVPSTAAIGKRVVVRATTLLASSREAGDADIKSYRVYLLRGFDQSILEGAWQRAGPGRGTWWDLGDAEAIDVSGLRVSHASKNSVGVRASFQVPALPAGRYAVMLCDQGCNRPLGEVIPRLGFTVVSDPATVRLARELAQARKRLSVQRDSLMTSRVAVRLTGMRLDRLATKVAELRADVAAARRENADPPTPNSAWHGPLPWIGIVIAGGLCALAWLLRRRQATAFDAELSALLAQTTRARDQSIVK